MKCHYEILEVSRDADLSEIKSAYRKFALKWHPDKNLDNTEYAKEQFQLVQQAYEVLSDPQERAWYDKHREQILRGPNAEYEDNSLDVFQYFTATCFKGYGDDENGFYTVYRNVFDQIIEEDLEFIDDKEVSDIPRFGNSRSDYDEIVGPFYSYWSSYCTKKSYVWLDPYNIKEIRCRKYLKLAEKENKKVRTKAKKERNDEVRNLVAFVRKRDKRVQEHTKLLEAKVLENRQKQEDLSKQRRMQRKKQLNESGVQAEWTRFDNVKSELEEIEKHLAQQFGEELSNSEEEEEDSINDLYCVACNKIFKTSKALENHESSKKHRENLGKLKAAMLEEEEEEEIYEGEEIELDYDLDDKVISEIVENSYNGPTDEESEDSTEKTKNQKKKKKKPKNIIKVADSEDTNCDIIKIEDENGDENIDFDSSKKQKKKNKKQNRNKTIAEDKIENDIEKNENLPDRDNRNNKKKQKKDKKNEDIAEIDTSHCCVTCKSVFPSKNKLFDHLKKTGHGVYLPNKKKC